MNEPAHEILQKLENVFGEIEVVDDRDVPDGTYNARVEKAELQTAKSGKLMLVWNLRILGPDYKGRMLKRRNMIATEQNVGWLKKDLVTCGVELGSLTALPGALGRLVGLVLDVTKRTKGEFEDVYINKRLASDADDADSLPF